MSLRAFDIRKTRADATSIVRFRTEELVLVFLSLFDHWHWVFVLTRAAILKRSQQMFRQYEMQFALYYNCLIFTLFFLLFFIIIILSLTRPDFDKEFLFQYLVMCHGMNYSNFWLFYMSKSFQNKEICFQDSSEQSTVDKLKFVIHQNELKKEPNYQN